MVLLAFFLSFQLVFLFSLRYDAESAVEEGTKTEWKTFFTIVDVVSIKANAQRE